MRTEKKKDGGRKEEEGGRKEEEGKRRKEEGERVEERRDGGKGMSCCTCPCLSRNCISKLRSATDLSSWRLEQAENRTT